MDDPRHSSLSPLRLRPGLHVVRRDDRQLQIGVDPPWRLVVPDEPTVRDVLTALGAGRPARPASAAARRVLRQLAAADMLAPVGPTGPGPAPRGVRITGTEPLTTEAARLVTAAGVAVDPEGELALVICDGEPSRDLVDEHVRDGRPHLVVAADPAGYLVGPFVVPGTTACLRCVDAHRSEADPRRPIVVAQLVGLRLAPRDPALDALAVAWAVRDLLNVAEGRTPVSWSASIRLGADLDPQRTSWTRHLHCGCAWTADLAG